MFLNNKIMMCLISSIFLSLGNRDLLRDSRAVTPDVGAARALGARVGRSLGDPQHIGDQSEDDSEAGGRHDAAVYAAHDPTAAI